MKYSNNFLNSVIKSVIQCFNFPSFAKGCFVWHYSYIWLSELGFQFITCCAREEEENMVIFVPLSILFVRASLLLFFYGTWEAAGECCGAGIVVCFVCPHTAKWQRGTTAEQAVLYSQCSVYQPKLWPVKSWLTPNFFRSSYVERQFLCQNWFWVVQIVLPF